MKFLTTHLAKIKDCKLIVKNLDKWRAVLLDLDGKDVRITIDRDIDTRSTQQNRFYWMCLSLIEDETGNTSDDLHEICKRKFLPPRFVTIKGTEYKLPATTTKMDKLEFSNYLDKISAWCGVPIPNDYAN